MGHQDDLLSPSSTGTPGTPSVAYTDEENVIENRANQSYKAFDLGTVRSDVEITADLFEKYKTKVFTARPNIGSLYTQNSATPIYSYSKSHIRENRGSVIKARKNDFIISVKEHIRKVLGSGVAESVGKQLKENHSIATAQHVSPFSHPDSINAILENALPYFDNHNPNFKNVLVFACAGVSLNNIKFPRGHLFHSFINGTMHTNQVSFFGHSEDARPVIHHPPYSVDAIIEIRNSLMKLLREEKITKDVYEKLTFIFEKIYNMPHPLSANNYSDQLTITNYWFFKEVFSQYKRAVPSLVYLSQEKVALDLLCTYHLHSDTTIHKLLFDHSVYPLIDTHFEGVRGAFSQEKGLGTYLFWGMSKKTNYRVQLWRDGNVLRAKDGSFSIELTPDAIEEAIAKNELIPSVMLTFCILAFYYGMFLSGGYEQTSYLTQSMKSYLAILASLQDTQSIAACEELITTNLVIPRPMFLYMDGANNQRIPATGLDMLLYGDQGKTWTGILEGTKQLTTGEAILRTLPSIYREFCATDDPSDVFAKITERDIESFVGFDKKIPPLARI